MMRSSVDIGSNTILLLAGEVSGHQLLKETANESEVTALGKDLDKNKAFHPVSMADSLEAFRKYKKILESLNLKTSDCLITATEASRVAQNAEEFYSQVKKDLGFAVTIISPAGEAYYSAKGAALDIQDDFAVIMDIGGASTELIKVQLKPFKILDFISMPIGSVRGTDWMATGSFLNNIEDIFEKYSNKLPLFETKTLCCVAGTMTAIANMYHDKKIFDEKVVHGTKLSHRELSQFIDRYKNLNNDIIASQFPFLGKRAKTIVAGSEIARLVSAKIKVQTLDVSTYGLRYGTLTEGGIKDEFIVKRF